MANIIMYTTPTCGYCRLAKQFFKEKNVAFTEKDVTADPAAMEEFRALNEGGVPVFMIDGQKVVGFNKDEISKLIGL
ncbi:glutaredoxin family protein [Candidatus Uhrbacteria bacterium]|nr:glutaredoxin family protein [Candidatus Uhrbacteria bacterium]